MVLNRVKQYYNLKTDSALAQFLDLQPNTLAMQRTRGTLPLDNILDKCTDVNMNWLLSKNTISTSMQTQDPGVSYDAAESIRNQELKNRIAELEQKLRSLEKT